MEDALEEDAHNTSPFHEVDDPQQGNFSSTSLSAPPVRRNLNAGRRAPHTCLSGL